MYYSRRNSLDYRVYVELELSDVCGCLCWMLNRYYSLDYSPRNSQDYCYVEPMLVYVEPVL
jgi:hypothetical protein